MIYISEQIEKWTKEGDCIIFIGDLNEYIYMQRVSFFFSKLGPRELIINKHRSGGPASTRYNIYDKDTITQKLLGHFMIQQLDTITTFNDHDPLSVPFQYVLTASLYTGNLIVNKTDPGRDPSRLGIWTWQRFRGQWNASLLIATFYRHISPSHGGGKAYFFVQNLT